MPHFRLFSPDFDDGAPIPCENTGEGADLSPALEWEDVPPSCEELVLICEDPDAPQPKPWVHWLLYKIPPSIRMLPEGLPSDEVLDNLGGCIQGTNSFGKIGYGGPMPPVGHGWHRYYFKLYALDQPLALAPGATKEQVWDAMLGHLIGEAELLGKYRREKARQAG